MPGKPFVDLPWDGLSDQPHVIADRAIRQQLRRGTWPELLKQVATGAVCLPAWALVFFGLRAAPKSVAELAGVAISPRPDEPQALIDLVAELGLQRLQIRCRPWIDGESERVWRCLEAFPGHEVLLVVPQDRRAVCEPEAFAAELHRLCSEAPGPVRTVQVGNAVNRLKWGCASIGEYLPLLGQANAVLADFPHLQLAGSAVIDFEPLATLRSLVNGHRWQADICSALLYVDRRGAPQNTQLGIFDTARKIRAVASAVRLSRKCANRLWITEVNWPLRGTGAHAPTSAAECVDEEAAGRYLADYLRIAAATGLVERVYVWQLIAKGYGLVDPDGLRRRPAFAAIRQLVSSETTPPSPS